MRFCFLHSLLLQGAALALSLVGVANAQSTFQWNAPTTNADSTPLTDLAGYRLKISSTQGNYTTAQIIEIVATSAAMPSGLKPGKYFAVVTAYDTSSNESLASNEITFNISASPTPAPTSTPQPTPTAVPTPIPGEDSDGDGIPDSLDNCSKSWNPEQDDEDQNGVGDACDGLKSGQSSANGDIDSDGTTDVVLFGSSTYNTYSASDSLPAAGQTYEGPVSKPAAMGFGDLLGIGQSLLVEARRGSKTLEWYAMDGLGGSATKISTFGTKKDTPVVGCHQSRKFFPAVVHSLGSNTSALQFKLPGSSRLKSLTLPRNSKVLGCVNDSKGTSLVYLKVSNSSQPSLQIVSLNGKTVRKVNYPQKKGSLFVLPEYSGLEQLVGFATSSSSKLNLYFYSFKKKSWSAVVKSELSASAIVSAIGGYHAAGFRWVAILTSDRAVKFVRLTSANQPESSWVSNIGAQSKNLVALRQ